MTMADILPGTMPHWRRDPDLVARDAPPADHPVLGEQFERDLEAAKRGEWRPPRSKRARRRG